MSSFTDKAKQVLATVAPWIGTAIGGPFGTVAGSLLATALGTKPGNSQSAEAAILAASPDTLLKLRQAEQDFQAKMKELGVQEEQLVFADIASARNLEIQTRSSTPTVLSYGILSASLAALMGILFGFVHLPTDPQTALLYGSAMTFMFTESKAVLSYWFGSSMGSQNKDATIADMAKA